MFTRIDLCNFDLHIEYECFGTGNNEANVICISSNIFVSLYFYVFFFCTVFVNICNKIGILHSRFYITKQIAPFLFVKRPTINIDVPVNYRDQGQLI